MQPTNLKRVLITIISALILVNAAPSPGGKLSRILKPKQKSKPSMTNNDFSELDSSPPAAGVGSSQPAADLPVSASTTTAAAKTKNPGPPIGQMPRELINKVSSHLDVKDFAKFGQACRQFKNKPDFSECNDV